MDQEKRAEELAKTNFYQKTVEMRDEWRQKRGRSVKIIKGKFLKWENNPQGLMRWYMHPAIEDTVHHSYFFYMQEIPPGGRSGKQHHPGGMIIFIKKGRGYSIIDGEKNTWKAGDLVMLPLRGKGVEFQHFNEDPEESVRLVACEPNLTTTLGVDRGSEWKQMEDAPTYLKGGNTK
jgi:gentisate 1,2-dioxygenase